MVKESVIILVTDYSVAIRRIRKQWINGFKRILENSIPKLLFS